jgi:hypothetical protein
MINYYPRTVKEFQEIIRRNVPGAKAHDKSEPASPEYLLSMLKSMQRHNVRERGRSIGEVKGILLAKGWLNNNDSRSWLQEDVDNGKE